MKEEIHKHTYWEGRSTKDGITLKCDCGYEKDYNETVYTKPKTKKTRIKKEKNFYGENFTKKHFKAMKVENARMNKYLDEKLKSMKKQAVKKEHRHNWQIADNHTNMHDLRACECGMYKIPTPPQKREIEPFPIGHSPQHLQQNVHADPEGMIYDLIIKLNEVINSLTR